METYKAYWTGAYTVCVFFVSVQAYIFKLVQCSKQFIKIDLSQWLDKVENDLPIYPFVLPIPIYNCSKVEGAESTVKQQEYKCFKLVNEILCIPQAKITLVKKDINAFCTVIAYKHKGMVLKP